jgi:hypothetical protein
MDDGKPIVRPTELQAQANLLSVLQLVGAGLTTLAADVTGRVAKVRDRGVVRLIECANAPLAKLIANDPRTHCALVGERHLAVPVEGEHDFRKALRRLGYVPTRD